jgi:AraC-like DNA-binding protein
MLLSDSIAVEMRRAGRPPAGSYVYEGDRMVTPWHSHDLHQIEYALRGVVEVETATAHYLLPPQQAAWIPAGLAHQSTINATVRSISVFFEPSLVAEPGARARILAMNPLVREMMVYAVRWPIERAASDPVADGFFQTLGHLVSDALEHEAPLSLPTSSDPVVAAAMAFTVDHLESVTASEVSRSVGVSERTLRRLFRTEVDMSWRAFLLRARMLRATALLAEPGSTVLRVATEVGFDSASAFARAFTRHCGEAPGVYRRRVRPERIEDAAAPPLVPARPAGRQADTATAWTRKPR